MARTDKSIRQEPIHSHILKVFIVTSLAEPSRSWGDISQLTMKAYLGRRALSCRYDFEISDCK